MTAVLFVSWAWAVGRYYPGGSMLEPLGALLIALGLMRLLSSRRTI
jgi:hypothetical protein